MLTILETKQTNISILTRDTQAKRVRYHARGERYSTREERGLKSLVNQDTHLNADYPSNKRDKHFHFDKRHASYKSEISRKKRDIARERRGG